MEKNMHIESDYSVLDVPRIRTIAMETGYSSVNLYDEVDSTTTRARELLMDGTDPEREQLGELSVYASLYQSAGRGRLARARTPPPAACDGTPDGDIPEHAACHLYQQDWGIPVVVTGDEADESELVLDLRGIN